MNQVIEQMKNRRSVRGFSGESVKDEDLKEILVAAQQAPSSVNGEQVSLVVIRDKDKIAKIAELAGGQPQVAGADIFILVTIDFYRSTYAMKKEGKQNVIPMSAEGILVGAVDGGIMLNALQTAAESFGYGTTAIGGIRRNPDKMVELLELPEGTFPLVGTTIGVPTEEEPSFVKPRVPLNSFAHTEKYDKVATEKGVDEYDLVLRKWWDDLGMTQMGNYSQDVSNYYQTIYFPTVAANLRKQGFEFQDELK